MSKKFSRRFDSYDYDDDMDYRSDYYTEIKERRKSKRMRNALRSKNLDDLLFDEDEY